MESDPSADTDDIEAIMALGMFNHIRDSAAVTAETGHVTQAGLIYSLWCFLNTHLIKEGYASEDMCKTILFTERFLHGQANPS
jgi:hypothetical protein